MERGLKTNFDKLQFIVITIFCYLIPNFLLHVLADRPSILTLLFKSHEFLDPLFFYSLILLNYILQFLYTLCALRKESFFNTSKIKNISLFLIYTLPGVFEISLLKFLMFGNQVSKAKKIVSIHVVVILSVVFSILKFSCIHNTSKWIRTSILDQRESQSPNKTPYSIEKYKSKFLNQSITLKEPWFLYKNYSNANGNDDSTFISNNKIIKIENRGRHIEVKKNGKNPMEVVYLPKGSKLKVIESFRVILRSNEFFLDEKESSEILCGYPVHFSRDRLLVLDENNNSAEITEGDFLYNIIGGILKENYDESERFLKYYAKFETEVSPVFTMCIPENKEDKRYIELEILEFLKVFGLDNEIEVISIADGIIENTQASCAKIKFNTQNAFFQMYLYKNSLVSGSKLILDDEIVGYKIDNEVLLNFPKLRTVYKGDKSFYARENYLISD